MFKTKNGLPHNSVRGVVRLWIEENADYLGNDVLEIGSRMHDPNAWWINNRDLAQGKWTGMDMQSGQNVDVVANVYDMPQEWTNRFSGVLCCEVLEHMEYPWAALTHMYRILQPEGLIVITVPWCFPKHDFPNDYFRYSTDGLHALLQFAGFAQITTATSMPMVQFDLNGFGQPHSYRGIEPTHSYAIARKPP
jgi:SAM-dependent methyltransferase